MRTLPLTALALLAAGCGGKPGTEFHVDGTVALAGRPVQSGRIYFTADRAKGNDGPQGVAVIADGTFDTRKDGRPAPPGPVVVRVDGYGPPAAGSNEPVPLLWEYTVERELPRADSTLAVDAPESARVKPDPKAGKSP